MELLIKNNWNSALEESATDLPVSEEEKNSIINVENAVREGNYKKQKPLTT